MSTLSMTSMRVGWVYSDEFLKHATGPTHPERAERLETIVSAMHTSGLLRAMVPLEFGPASVETLAMVHEPAYIELVRRACDDGMTFIGSLDTRISFDSYEVARLAVGGTVAACDAVMSRQIDRAFCAVRPPGHHAERDQAMGFCLFNNVAIAAEHLVRHHKLERVAIVDFDVHHGNGTQHIFEDRPDVLYVSIHEHPLHRFPGTGFSDETGKGAGKGATMNVMLLPGADETTYRRVISTRVAPRLREFGPQFILLSAGFDAARGEGIANMNLEPDSFGWITWELASVANEVCAGRVVSVLEGGYNRYLLSRCVVAHVRALMR